MDLKIIYVSNNLKMKRFSRLSLSPSLFSDLYLLGKIKTKLVELFRTNFSILDNASNYYLRKIRDIIIIIYSFLFVETFRITLEIVYLIFEMDAITIFVCFLWKSCLESGSSIIFARNTWRRVLYIYIASNATGLWWRGA